MSIAATILSQLGGNKFLAMTGAKNLLNGGDYLQFDLPAIMTKGKANKFRVTLEPSDTYTLTAMKYSRRTFDCKTLETASDVHCDNLREVFERMTGLYTIL